jgi:DNA-binding CsgD family transcriptional regulator
VADAWETARVQALIEREQLLSTLTSLLADVHDRHAGRVVFVGGEAGVGKTTLVRRFSDDQPRSTRVLWGAAEPLRTPRPLGPVADVAEATNGELAELIDAGARPHDVAMALLRELRGPRTTVLVLEDLHWADEATLDVLTLLAARTASVPALVLATYRDDELDRAPQLRAVLGETARGRGRLKVAPLSPAGVAELAAAHAVEPAELYRTTDGNPFFVSEVLAAGGERMPDTVRDAVLARAARLTAPARQLLEAVAIVPGRVDTPLLEAMAGDLTAHLDECLGSGMLNAGRADVAFRHELARLAIEESVAPTRRLALHRAALAALAHRAHPEPARLADHAEAAGDAENVLRWAPRAAERAAAAGAHREAAAQYARALRVADALPPEERAALLRRRADECYLTAELDAAIQAQRGALECHRQLQDALGEGDALRRLSRLLFFAGRTDDAEPVALAAVEHLERLPPGHELAMAYGNVAQRRAVLEDPAEVAHWSGRALALAGELDDAEAHVYALTTLGASEFQADRPAGREKLERALALAQQHGLDDHAGRAYFQLVICGLRHRRFALVRRYVDAGLEYCGERDLDTWRVYLRAAAARLDLDTGRWDAAADTATAVLADRRSAPVARTWALIVIGLLRARRGDAGAQGPLDEAHAIVHATSELFRIGPLACARAEAAWLAGQGDAVPAVTDAALALAVRCDARWITGELAYWRHQAGLTDDVVTAGPYHLSLAGDAGGAAERWRALGCPYEAALAAADGDDDGAIRAAIEDLQQLGARAAERIVARRLRERGVRGVPRGPRPRTRENPAGLTVRELEVLGLLAEGLRNAQIAQRLVVSEKTVGHHVSAVLRKLDVQTRGEAAAKAARLGLTGQPS